MEAKIRQLILTWLARRDYSQKEVSEKLRAKGYPPASTHSIITQFVETGLIKDERFAEHYTHWRRARGYGPERIMMELQIRGIPAEVIAEVLEITDNAWFTEARKIWQKHFKGKLPTDFKTRAKQMRFLQHRGFTREQINSVIKDIYDD